MIFFFSFLTSQAGCLVGCSVLCMCHIIVFWHCSLCSSVPVFPVNWKLGLNQGRQTVAWPPIFINKVLLEHHAYSLTNYL